MREVGEGRTQSEDHGEGGWVGGHLIVRVVSDPLFPKPEIPTTGSGGGGRNREGEDRYEKKLRKKERLKRPHPRLQVIEDK